MKPYKHNTAKRIGYKIKRKLFNKSCGWFRYGHLKFCFRLWGEYHYHLLRYGSYEADTLWVYEGILRPGMTVWDVGANAGVFSVIASDQVGGEGHVFSFEPDPYAREQLQRHAQLNNANNMQILAYALSNKNEPVRFFVSEDSVYSSMNQPIDACGKSVSVEVQSVSLDALEGSIANCKPDVIKLDAEGQEINILKGGKQFFEGLEDVLIICEFSPDAQTIAGEGCDALLQAFENMGFKVYDYQLEDAVWKPVNTIDFDNYRNLFVTKNIEKWKQLMSEKQNAQKPKVWS